MDVIVNVQGKGGGPLGGSPASVEVRVENWRGMPHNTDALVADVTVQACEAYERLMREQRVLEQARSERSHLRSAISASLASARDESNRALEGREWLRWADGMAPEEVGDWDTFVVAVSHALGEMDSDWLDAELEPRRPVLDRIAARVAEIVQAMKEHLEAGEVDAIDERFGTAFGFDAAQAISDMIDRPDVDAIAAKEWVDVPDGGEVLLPGGSVKITPEVPILPDPGEPHYGNVGSLEVRRCARIGEHEPHTWGAEGTYHCQGEVF